jgi:hypothetical protein
MADELTVSLPGAIAFGMAASAVTYFADHDEDRDRFAKWLVEQMRDKGDHIMDLTADVAENLTGSDLRGALSYLVSEIGDKVAIDPAAEGMQETMEHKEFEDAAAAAQWMRRYAKIALGMVEADDAKDRPGGGLGSLYRAMVTAMHESPGAAHHECDKLAEAGVLIARKGWL